MSVVAQPSGTVTLVFTDIEGSTRLLEELGTEAYREALGEHRRVVREACARHAGYEVDYEGDAFFYAFASAADAAAAVSEFMAALEDGPIRIRVGVHTGEPALDPPKYVGMDVHRAARIMSSAHGGQVVLSDETVALLPPEEFELKHLGRHRLKDLSSPIPLHQLLIDGLPAEFPRLKTLYHSTLPVPATPFLGRETEVAAVVERLADPETRLLSLTGPGGTGKTRLALQAAAEAADRFPDGVFWVPLAPVRDPQLVLPTIARAVEVSERADEELIATLATALLGKRALLVLDNMEHLLPAAARELAALLRDCPTVELLVTSRETLQIGPERVWPVPTLDGGDSVRLFLERAVAVRPDFAPSDEVRVICDRLDRLPLAIELAAARVRSLSPAAILERLDDRLAFLTLHRHDVDDRQRTLRATIAWSYDLLDPDERRALACLSVFAGGCTLEAAVAVAGADLDLIESLLDKSLLRHRVDQAGQDRYWMLETIREYAVAKLDESGAADATRAHHAGWFGDLAWLSDRSAWSATTERVDSLEADLDNLRAAFAWWVAVGDSTRALEMAVGLFTLWEMRDRMGEGDSWLETALALPSDDRTELRGMAYGARCGLGYHLGRDDESLLSFAEAGVSIMRDAGAESGLAQALTALSWAQRSTDLDAALASGEEALASARRSASLTDLRGTLHNVGELRRDAGDFDRASELLHEAIQVSRDLQDMGFVAATTHSLGDLELDRGDDKAAWRLYLEAGSLGIAESVPQQVALCVGGMAAVAARRGQPGLARILWSALESWEHERGVQLSSYERTRYERHVGAIGGPGDEQAPTLEQVIGLARDAII